MNQPDVKLEPEQTNIEKLKAVGSQVWLWCSGAPPPPHTHTPLVHIECSNVAKRCSGLASTEF